VHPNLLLRACTVSANPQNILHLRVANEQNLPGNEEPDSLTARRAGKTAPVSPHLAEIADLLQRHSRSRSAIDPRIKAVEVGEARLDGQGGGLLSAHRHAGVVGGQERRLAEEVGVAEDARVDADGEHGALGAVLVDVHEVQLGFGAVVLHAVVGGRVHVPADEVDGLVDAVVVEGEVGGVEVDGAVDGGRAGGALRFGEGEGRAVAPVVVGALDRAAVVKDWEVRGREALLEVQGDRGLLGADLAELEVGGEHAPVLTFVVGPCCWVC
jgi:hypothetical protein